MAAALFPEAQYPTRALAASSAVGCGAGESAGADVVGTGTVAGGVVVVVLGAAVVVVLGAAVVVVVGAEVGVVLHADAVTTRKAATAATRTERCISGCVTIPL